MSGEGPESIPTSADPRSRRPLKKRALTPVSEQASALDALFARPDQEIRLPPSASSSALAAKDQLPAPPEIVSNVQGSSAGAGSGEFHVYKAARRREYERLRRMDDEVRRERADDEFARKRAELEAKDDERTRRNREKREKMKARKSKARAGGGGKDGQDANGAAAASPAPAPKMMARPVLRIDRHASDAEEDAETAGQTAAPAAEPAGLMIHDDD